VENKKKFVLKQKSTGRQFNVKAVSIKDAKQKLKKYLADSEEKAHAVFCIVPVSGGFAATTRAADRGEQGKIGLPGGKVDLGEDMVSALYRECEEEGWTVKGISPEPVHTSEVEGKPVAWYTALSAEMLENYKEQHRIQPIVASVSDLAASGYGNEEAFISYFNSQEDEHISDSNDEPIDTDWKAKFKPLLDRGYDLFVVGGSTRDKLLGTESNDIDLSTNAPLEEILEIMKGHRIDAAGLKFGHINVDGFDIGEYREDLYEGEGDGRHPTGIVKADDIVKDLSRRDFTINAIAEGPNGEFIDPFGGREDLKNGIIRFVGDPKDKLKQDNIRALRAFRFASRYGFDFAPETWEALKSHTSLDGVSPERVGDELRKIVVSKDAPTAIRRMAESGILYTIIPELEGQLMPHNSPKHHAPTNILEHTLRVFTETCEKTKSFISRMAALLHDVGKPTSYQEKEDGTYSYIGHDEESAKITENILRRLRYTKHDIDAIVWIVSNHMRAHNIGGAKQTYKKREFAGHKYHEEGRPVFNADMHGEYDAWFEPFKEKYKGEFLPKPEITAKDLIAKGIEPGPKMGELLRQYYIQQLNRDPKFNDSVSDNMKVKFNVACACLFDSIFNDAPKHIRGMAKNLTVRKVSDDFATPPGSQFEGINTELQNRYDLVNKILETVNTVLMSTVIGGPHYTERFELEGLKPYSLKSSVDNEGKAILRLITEGAPEFATEGPLNQLDLTDFANEAFGSVVKGDLTDFDGQ